MGTVPGAHFVPTADTVSVSVLHRSATSRKNMRSTSYDVTTPELIRHPGSRVPLVAIHGNSCLYSDHILTKCKPHSNARETETVSDVETW